MTTFPEPLAGAIHPPQAIAVRGLSKSFPIAGSWTTYLSHRTENPPGRDVREVLRDVNLDVAPGSIVGLLGPNGVGKTTLLEILCTLLLPTSGQAFVQGLDVVRDAAAVKNLVGYCPSGFDSFYPRLTAAANLQFFAALHGLPPNESRQRLDAVFDLVGVNGSRDLDFQRHSAGMKQRLVLARALIANPAILLLDEPTRSLDPRAQREMWRLLRTTIAFDLQKTILLVTHSLAEAQEVCDRVVMLDEGRIVEVGAPASLTPSRLAEIFGAPCEMDH